MTLPSDFQFSQASLQDYVDCPRRFQLRYIQRLDWPAIEAEPALEHERQLRQGAAFHRLVHQHVLGLSPQRLSSMVTDKDLSRWWDNYLNSAPAHRAASRYPEVVLSAPLSGHRLVAKYDLIAVGPVLSTAEGPGQRAVILDWKTSRKRPRRKWLAERLQTRVYPYLLVRAGSHLNEGWPFQPDQVEMVYWFANFPEDPEVFPYDAAQYEVDSDYLTSLIEEIKSLADEDFTLTAQEQHCRYCPYRSLCRRGTRAGAFDEAESEPEASGDFEIALDFEQIAEIEF
jgi:CRISPR/Cas system-associated exonuclease Cas4 (RecB family)